MTLHHLHFPAPVCDFSRTFHTTAQSYSPEPSIHHMASPLAPHPSVTGPPPGALGVPGDAGPPPLPLLWESLWSPDGPGELCHPTRSGADLVRKSRSRKPGGSPQGRLPGDPSYPDADTGGRSAESLEPRAEVSGAPSGRYKPAPEKEAPGRQGPCSWRVPVKPNPVATGSSDTRLFPHLGPPGRFSPPRKCPWTSLTSLTSLPSST